MTDVSEPTPNPLAALPMPAPKRPAPQKKGSKGVAITNWMVSRASGILERTTSRRGFLVGSAMAGSAVAIAGCVPITQPGPPYTHITDCAGSFCNDGYTEFCCSLTGGLNVCPSDSFAGGWWRADFSTFCNGTRYYIDCMQYCSGPLTGYQNFCSSTQECRCANGCDTRRVYCNYFRYGQCHVDDQPTSGPIACRIVTCVAPYTVAEWDCDNVAAVDNATAEHSGHCPPPPPPPPPPPRIAAMLASTGAAVQDAGGRLSVFVRGTDGAVYHRDNSGGWGDWQWLGGFITSGITAAVVNDTTYLVARGTNKDLYGNRRDGNTWSGWHTLPGASNSDPVALAVPGGIVLLLRGTDNRLYANRFDGSSWQGWIDGGGGIDSEPAIGVGPGGVVHVMARGPDLHIYANQLSAGSFQGWSDTGGIGASNPAVVGTASGAVATTRAPDGSVHWTENSGAGWGSWGNLAGVSTSDPVMFVDDTGVHVIVRGTDEALYHNRRSGGSWTGWMSLGGGITADAVTASAGSGSTNLFVRGDGKVYQAGLAGDVFSGWVDLGGGLSPIRATP